MRDSLIKVDIGVLHTRGSDRRRAVDELGRACREQGFFHVTGHGVDAALVARLEAAARAFFALPLDEKLAIRMERGGRAWRGYFPVGAELTSGAPDRKEGLYLGAELGPDDPRVAAGWPLHGANLFPAQVPELRAAVLGYVAAMTRLGHALVEALALALGLDAGYFDERYTRDPLVLFRLFHYPPLDDAESAWSVGEHADYGLLTILGQDDAGGLQVRLGERWVDVPPLPGAFVCNLGDMLDRLTGGELRSTRHRVRNASGRARLSYPFFFDPAFDARVEPLPGRDQALDDAAERWDGVGVRASGGTYGDYLLSKVARVFPALGRGVL